MPAHPHSTWRFAAGITAATLAIFGLLVTALTWQLRERLRAGVLEREAEAIHAVALMELSAAGSRSLDPVTEDGDDILFAAVLESSRLRGVLAVELFDAAGRLREALPETGAHDPLTRWWPGDLSRPVAQFNPAASLEGIFGAEIESGAVATLVPVLEVVVPLRLEGAVPPVAGVARYWVSGDAVHAELRRMDRGLLLQAGLAYAGTALLVAMVLGWAFRRLAEASRRLAEQREDLARANEELDFAAKTGAIGAISAHLIHGLKNPLAGLESFVADSAANNDSQRGEAWAAAVETTRQLQAMVHEVMTVLRDEALGRADYPVPLNEVLESILRRARPAARSAGVTVQVDGETSGVMLARTANLAGLVIWNLVLNAIEASPRGATVILQGRETEQELEVRVEDAGGGIPGPVRTRLFRPIKSTKGNGGGVGLAISRQLARHLGGDLHLLRSDATGTVFSLRVPVMLGAARPV